MASAAPPTPAYARNMRLLGHSDMGGRPDGQQVMVNQGYAYVGHMFSQGFSVIDVRDPRAPRGGRVRAVSRRDVEPAFAISRRPAARRERAGSRARKDPRGRPAVLLGVDERAPGRGERPRVRRGCPDLRHLRSRRAARDRLRPDRRCRRAPRLVHGRPLGVRVGDARRLERLHLHGARCGRSDEARVCRVFLASRHAHVGRRDADVGRANGTRAITGSSRATRPT